MSILAMLNLGEECKGESTMEGYEDWIQLSAVSFGVSNPSSAGTGPGAGRGKADLTPMQCTMPEGPHLAEIYHKCCKGTHFEGAILGLFKTGGAQPMLFIEQKFDKAFVDYVQIDVAGDGEPIVNVSFAFGSMELTYNKQKDDGTQGDSFTISYDQQKVA